MLLHKFFRVDSNVVFWNYDEDKKIFFCCGKQIFISNSSKDIFYVCPVCGRKYLVDCEGRAFPYPD